jgi:hypothetical protein
MNRTKKLFNKIFNIKNINQNVLKADYAVRGQVVLKADKIKKIIKNNPTGHGYPFEGTYFFKKKKLFIVTLEIRNN